MSYKSNTAIHIVAALLIAIIIILITLELAKINADDQNQKTAREIPYWVMSMAKIERGYLPISSTNLFCTSSNLTKCMCIDGAQQHNALLSVDFAEVTPPECEAFLSSPESQETTDTPTAYDFSSPTRFLPLTFATLSITIHTIRLIVLLACESSPGRDGYENINDLILEKKDHRSPCFKILSMISSLSNCAMLGSTIALVDPDWGMQIPLKIAIGAVAVVSLLQDYVTSVK